MTEDSEDRSSSEEHQAQADVAARPLLPLWLRILGRIVRWISRLVLLLISITLVLICTFAASLAFEQGRLFWVEHAVVLVNKKTPARIDIENFRWPEVGRLTSDSLAVALHDEPLVAIEQLDFDLSARHLLGLKQLRIQRLYAKRIDITIPQSQAPAEDKKPPVENPLALIPTQLPKLPQIQFDELNIEQLNLHGIAWPHAVGPNGLAIQGRLAVNSEGGANASERHNAIAGELIIIEPNITQLNLSLSTDSAHNVTADIRLEQIAQGWLCRWATLPCEAPLQANLQAQLLPVDGQILVTLRDTRAKFIGESLGLAGGLRFHDETDRIALEGLTLMARKSEHTIKGWLDNTGADIQVAIDGFPLIFAKPWYPDMTGGKLNAVADLLWQEPIWKNPIPTGSATVTASPQIRQTAVNADMRVKFENGVVSIGNAKVTSGDMAIVVKGRFDIPHRKPTITVTANHLKDDKLRALLPPAIAKHIPSDIQFHAQQIGALLRGTLEQPVLMADVNILGQYRELPFLIAGSAFGGLKNVTLQGMQIRSGSTDISAEGTVDLEGAETELAVDVARFKPEILVKLGIPVPSELSGSASFQASVVGKLTKPKFEVSGRYQGGYQYQSEVLPFNVRLAASGQWAGLDKTAITIEEFSFATFTKPLAMLEGRLSVNDSDLGLRIRRLPARFFDVLGYSLGDGRAEANLRLTGPWRAPALNGYVSYGETLALRTADNQRKEVPLILHSNIESPDGNLIIDSSFTLDRSHAGEVRLEAPWHDILEQLMKGAGKPMRLAGKLSADVDTKAFQLFLDTDQSSVGGQVVADVSLGGNVQAPELSGLLKFHDGYFRQLSTGTTLNNIILDAQFVGQKLELKSLSAKDNGEGRLELAGELDWQDRLQNPLIDLNLNARSISLYETTMVNGAVSGKGGIKGPLQSPSVTGRFELRPLNINIDSVPASRVPQIEVTEIYDEEDIEAEKKGANIVAKLDIEVNVDKQAYVRGRGLSAELAGKIAIKGTSENPLVSGAFKTLKGEISLLDRPIKLNEGTAQFTDSAFSYSIPATFKRDDVEINILISGNNDEITMTLSSVPDMPQEEILSFLLFGESVQNISALQAIRLASAINTINKGSSFDPVGSARNFLGVDTLNIGQEQEQEGGGVNIGVGKYLNERVYIEFEQSSNPAKSWEGHLEIELNDNFHLESSTTGEGRSGVSLEWERDY